MNSVGKTLAFLVADDDDDDRLMISDAFAECEPNVRLDVVEDGEEVLRYLRREGSYERLKNRPLPDIVILDLNMPRMDGRATIREIKKDEKLCTIPVIVLTTSRSEEDIMGLYELGASSFITKPFSYKKLCKVVSGMCHYWSELVALPSDKGRLV